MAGGRRPPCHDAVLERLPQPSCHRPGGVVVGVLSTIMIKMILFKNDDDDSDIY